MLRTLCLKRQEKRGTRCRLQRAAFMNDIHSKLPVLNTTLHSACLHWIILTVDAEHDGRLSDKMVNPGIHIPWIRLVVYFGDVFQYEAVALFWFARVHTLEVQASVAVNMNSTEKTVVSFLSTPIDLTLCRFSSLVSPVTGHWKQWQ